jgi:hypothetical protein
MKLYGFSTGLWALTVDPAQSLGADTLPRHFFFNIENQETITLEKKKWVGQAKHGNKKNKKVLVKQTMKRQCLFRH